MKPIDPDTKKKSSGGIRTFRSLKNPVYRLYFIGMLGQFASMNMQMVTGSLLLYRLTDSAALLGTMSLVVAIPMIFLSLFGGAIADRFQKKQILVLGLQAHHVLPQKFEPQFNELGINIHDPKYGAWVDQLHQSWSDKYNRQWEGFLRNEPNLTVAKIENFGKWLAVQEPFSFKVNY